MTPRPGLLRGSKIKNYKGSNALRVTWSPPPGFSILSNIFILNHYRYLVHAKIDFYHFPTGFGKVMNGFIFEHPDFITAI